MTTHRLTTLVLSAFWLSGCAPNGPKSYFEAAGEYVFLAPGGQVEVMILNPDATHKQELYSNIISYKNQAVPLTVNTGQWRYNRNVITFDPWLQFFVEPDLKKLSEPPISSKFIGAVWLPPSGNLDANLELSEAFNYVLFRVKNREEASIFLEKMLDAKNKK